MKMSSLLPVLFLAGVGWLCGMEVVLELANDDEMHMVLHEVNEDHLVCSFQFLPDSKLTVTHDKVRKIVLSNEAVPPRTSGQQISLEDYSEFYGHFKRLGKTSVVFQMAGGDTIELPLKAVGRIREVNAEIDSVTPQESAYVIRTKAGDMLIGALTQRGDDAFQIKSETLEATVRLKNVELIQFPLPELMTEEEPEDVKGKLFAEVNLRNGGRLFGREPKLQGSDLRFTLSSGPLVSVALEQIATLAFTRSMIPNSRNILVWEQFADQDEESAKSIKILKEGLKGWQVEAFSTPPVGPEFRAKLLSSRAWVIPEMESWRSSTIKSQAKVGERKIKWSDLLENQTRPIVKDYLRRGGRVVLLCIEPEHRDFVNALDLVEIDVADRSREVTVPFTPAGARIAKGIGKEFETTDATAFYRPKAPAVSWAVDDKGEAPIIAQSYGPGMVVVMGMDYFEYNDETARLLVNSVSMP